MASIPLSKIQQNCLKFLLLQSETENAHVGTCNDQRCSFIFRHAIHDAKCQPTWKTDLLTTRG